MPLRIARFVPSNEAGTRISNFLIAVRPAYEGDAPHGAAAASSSYGGSMGSPGSTRRDALSSLTLTVVTNDGAAYQGVVTPADQPPVFIKKVKNKQSYLDGLMTALSHPASAAESPYQATVEMEQHRGTSKMFLKVQSAGFLVLEKILLPIPEPAKTFAEYLDNVTMERDSLETRLADVEQERSRFAATVAQLQQTADAALSKSEQMEAVMLTRLKTLLDLKKDVVAATKSELGNARSREVKLKTDLEFTRHQLSELQGSLLTRQIQSSGSDAAAVPAHAKLRDRATRTDAYERMMQEDERETDAEASDHASSGDDYAAAALAPRRTSSMRLTRRASSHSSATSAAPAAVFTPSMLGKRPSAATRSSSRLSDEAAGAGAAARRTTAPPPAKRGKPSRYDDLLDFSPT